MESVSLTNKGFTLVEFLVAVVILMVGLLGLLQTINLAFSVNTQNQVRNEAIGVADTEMAKELAKGYDGVDIGNAAVFRGYTVSRRILTTFKMYSVSKTGTMVPNAATSQQNSKMVSIEVSWKYKGQRFTHNASSVLSRANQ